jgi:ABC-2 type transport system permease protein
LINTPIKTPELMLGKILPYFLIGLIQLVLVLVLVLGLGWYFFQVPIRGSLVHVLAAALVFIAANLSLGLLVSTVAATQFQAMQMAFFFFLPSILISGFMFPFDGMPAAAQNIAEFLPLTQLIRGIVLRGADITSMLDELLALAIFTSVTLTLAILRFSKRLD